MNYKEWKNPDKLIDWGFDKEEEASSDYVRWVWYKKEIAIGSDGMYFQIVVTYDLTISDCSTASYAQNRIYSYEKTECLLKDESGQTIFETSFNFRSKKDLDKLEAMFG